MQDRKGIDVTQLTLNELDRIYEEEHFAKVSETIDLGFAAGSISPNSKNIIDDILKIFKKPQRGIKDAFSKDPNTFNPEGLVRNEYNNGKIIKWHGPKTRKAVYEWNADVKYGDHYRFTPDGKNRIPHPDTGDTHINPGESVPKINK